MADTKISAYAALTAVAHGDLIPVVDVSDTSMAASGTTKYITAANATQLRSWVNFNSTGTLAVRASYNVSSVTDNGTGDYTVNYTTALSDTSAAYLVTTSQMTSGTGFSGLFITQAAPTTSALRIFTSNNTGGGLLDCEWVSVVVFR